MRLITIAALMAAAASPAAAETLPRYSMEKSCDALARASGARSEVVYAGCMRMEEQSFDALSDRWGNLPYDTRRVCDELAQAGGGSYVVLKGCVDQEDAARASNGARATSPRPAVAPPADEEASPPAERYWPLKKHECRYGRLVELRRGLALSRACIGG